MRCLGCPRQGSLLCHSCAHGLNAGGERRIPGGVTVASALRHAGPARDLVRLLKYRGVAPASAALAAAMIPLVASSTALVPVPRSTLRRWRYGVDPALELALELRRATGVPVIRALRPPLWVPPRAGPDPGPRPVPRFRLSRPVPSDAVLVDDVLTTGSTLAAASSVSGARRAITATVAGQRPLVGLEAPGVE